MNNKLLAWVLFFMCISALFLTSHVVRADEDGDDEESVPETAQHEHEAEVDDDGEDIDEAAATEPEEQEVLSASDSVVTTFLFPDFLDKKLPVGGKVTVLVGFSNRGSSVYNLTHIGASLHSPFDYNYYIQNFTYREVDSLIEPGEEGTIEYSFTPDKSLEPLEFHLSLTLYYNDTTNNQFYRNAIINGTVELVDLNSGLDVKTVFQYILAIAGLLLAGYIGLNLTGSLNKGGVIERGTRSAAPTEGQKNAAKASFQHEFKRSAKPTAVRKSSGKKVKAATSPKAAESASE